MTILTHLRKGRYKGSTNSVLAELISGFKVVYASLNTLGYSYSLTAISR